MSIARSAMKNEVRKMNNDRLLKLLRMTTSDNDHEALTAIRLINKSKIDWAVVIQGKSSDLNEVYKYKTAYERALKNTKTLEGQLHYSRRLMGEAAERIKKLESELTDFRTRVRRYKRLPWYIRIFTKFPV